MPATLRHRPSQESRPCPMPRASADFSTDSTASALNAADDAARNMEAMLFIDAWLATRRFWRDVPRRSTPRRCTSTTRAKTVSSCSSSRRARPAQFTNTSSAAGVSPRRRPANLFDRTGTLLYKIRTSRLEPSAGRGDRNAKAVHPRACAWSAPGCGGNRPRELRRRSREHWHTVLGTTSAPNISVPETSPKVNGGLQGRRSCLCRPRARWPRVRPPSVFASAILSAIGWRSRGRGDHSWHAIESRRARRRPLPQKAGSTGSIPRG